MTPSLRIGAIDLYSTDPFKTAEFYNIIGLNLVAGYGWTGYENHFYVYKKDNGQKIFFTIYKKETETKEVTSGLGFRISNRGEVAVKLLAAGYEIVRPHPNSPLMSTLNTKDEQTRIEAFDDIYLIFRDPDGRNVQLFKD